MPAELGDVVSKALEVRAEGGYEAAATCAADLRSVAAMLDTRAAASEPSRVAPRRDRGSRLWVVAAVVLALGVLAALWRLL